MATFFRPLPIECLGYRSWPLRSRKEIPLFIEDVTELTCSHSSMGCLGICSSIFRLCGVTVWRGEFWMERVGTDKSNVYRNFRTRVWVTR